jgi:putative ABC transport system permease protein
MPAHFTKNRFSLRSVWYYRRLGFSVALGVATAATVITGALLVGDSMRGSLKSLTVDRLGKIDQLVVPGTFFAVDGIPQTVEGRSIIPAVLFDRAVVETAAKTGETVRRASSVQILGIDVSFAKLDTLELLPTEPLAEDEVILNRAAADELGISVGDQVTVRLPSEQAVPADSPLGKRDSQTEGIPRLKVVEIIDNRGLGRFSLHPSQVEPMTAFLNRETIAATLDREGQANVIFASLPEDVRADADGTTTDPWVNALPLRLADLGLKVSHVKRTFEQADQPPTTILDYYQVTSDRLLLPQAAADQLMSDADVTSKPQATMTYLANAIERVDADGNVTASVPYSIITAVDSSDTLPLDYQLADEDKQTVAPETTPIVINDWTAKALGAAVGDRLRIAYYEPEVEGGREIERTFDATLTAIVPITTPSKPYRRSRANEFDAPPTVYNDPDLTPSVPGVTDQDSISDWDLPFKLDRKISAEDDKYWADHRLTPKAFIPLGAGQRYFGSRFGDTTSLRFASEAVEDASALEASVREKLLPIRAKLGWTGIAIRENQLAASRGTTPFDALFLSLSLFVILAAVMLISLLYRLGMLQRGKEYGVLLASGWTGEDVSKLAIREGMWSSLPGVAIGLLGGLAYAWLVLAGLRSWWVGAVTVPFLEFHATTRSFVIGAIATLAVAILTIWLTARRLRKATAQSLLAGRVEESRRTGSKPTTPGRWSGVAMVILLVAAIGTLVFGSFGSGLAQAGAFVGAGMLLLLAALLFIHRRLSMPPARRGVKLDSYSLSSLSAANLRRNPLRSTLAIGLMAVATFLIVSIGAFQLRPTESGVGGFSLLASTATPLYRDLNDPVVQTELLGRQRDLIGDARIVSVRLKTGQDASCNNLYQAERPQVLAMPRSMTSEKDDRFDWAATSHATDEGVSAWKPLEKAAKGTLDDPIPLVLDQNTAMWSLQMRGGVGEVRSFEWTDGNLIHFEVVGLLSNSVLQGSLLIGEENFERVFPEVSGYQFFLIRTTEPATVTEVLESRLSDVGMDVVDSAQVLSRLMAVQNTYLKTFQSLGALGLLLGTLGLAIAQLRSALERQGELAVMRAIGFSRYRLGSSVMIEAVYLLLLGIGCGLLCSGIAIAPNVLAGQVLPPVAQPLLAILGIVIVGLVAGAVTVARVIRMPLIQSLRQG